MSEQGIYLGQPLLDRAVDQLQDLRARLLRERLPAGQLQVEAGPLLDLLGGGPGMEGGQDQAPLTIREETVNEGMDCFDRLLAAVIE